MLVFNLKTVMQARQIERPYSFLVKAGISPHSANDLLHSQTRTFRLDHIEKLCEILHCEPNDLIAFKPNNTQKLQENHALNKFIQKEETFDWQETIKTMPITQLKEIGKFLNQAKESKDL
jgi:DNA-binding Xre family transcriptional regulator